MTTELLYFFKIIMIFLIYVGTDKIFTEYFKFNGVYYLLHTINNGIITYYTYPALTYSFQNITEFDKYETTDNPIVLTFALHLYHIVIYLNKLRFDDWLHHILMCFFVLPAGLYINSGCLLDYSLFFITGVPGGISYFVLFLNRNNYITRHRQKQIDTYINLWIRTPGCISSSTLSLVVHKNFQNNYTYSQSCVFYFIVVSIYWNGIYFMNQTVQNYALFKERRQTKKLTNE